MGLSSKIMASIAYEQAGAASLGEVNARFAGNSPTLLPSGTVAGAADVVYAATITLAASGTQNIDLAGALTGPTGSSATFAKIKGICVRAADGNANSVVVGGAATNAFVGPFGAAAHTVSVPPGGAFLISAPASGWPVVGATGDLLKVANSGAGTSVTFEVVIIGTSA